MKIYTRTGDGGETDLPEGARAAKDVILTETLGTLDELGATIGLARAEPLPEDSDALLSGCQNALLAIGAELSGVDPEAMRFDRLGPRHVARMEEAIDRHEAELAPMTEFILPTGSRAAAALHHARAVCRRAERRVVTLAREGESVVSPDLQAYMNRLSDLLFVLARVANAQSGCGDVPWKKRGE
ncbi:MAG: cob(I)yrinic acid a,c-diamide adenosyltransferase [Candidatus Nealsonbacteria bacterium]|nr:cob(I)yrinic acid a,c-diamide adenosyltransferase [Candidatus Nealsonbacteria bacterium]